MCKWDGQKPGGLQISRLREEPGTAKNKAIGSGIVKRAFVCSSSQARRVFFPVCFGFLLVTFTRAASRGWQCHFHLMAAPETKLCRKRFGRLSAS